MSAETPRVLASPPLPASADVVAGTTVAEEGHEVSGSLIRFC